MFFCKILRTFEKLPHLDVFQRNIALSKINNDWIRRTTTRKPEIQKINRPYTLTLDEKIEIPRPDLKQLSLEEKQLVDQCDSVLNNLIENKNERISCVVHIGGKQFKITTGDVISTKSHNDEIDVGEVVYLDKVMLALSKDMTLVGRPLLPMNSVKIAARVVEKTLTSPVIKFHFHRRRRHKKFRIVQMPTTVFKILDIRLNNL